ncbi:MAG: type 1 glutamine amidotransferase [Pseudomonadota bacterium]
MIQIGILETGQNRPELVEEFGTFAGWFEDLFAESRLDLSFATFVVCEDDLPSHPEACHAYIITGSAASSNDSDAWIRNLEDFIRIASKNVPIIGVCFGHQVIHKALGGRVERAKQGWGVGVHDYDLTDPPPWMACSPSHLSFCASHNDQVVEPAPDTNIIARSEFCPVAATTVGRNVLTVQSHPEMRKSFSRELYGIRRELLGDERADTAISSLGKPTNEKVFVEMVEQFLMARLEIALPETMTQTA